MANPFRKCIAWNFLATVTTGRRSGSALQEMVDLFLPGYPR